MSFLNKWLLIWQMNRFIREYGRGDVLTYPIWRAGCKEGWMYAPIPLLRRVEGLFPKRTPGMSAIRVEPITSRLWIGHLDHWANETISNLHTELGHLCLFLEFRIISKDLKLSEVKSWFSLTCSMSASASRAITLMIFNPSGLIVATLTFQPKSVSQVSSIEVIQFKY